MSDWHEIAVKFLRGERPWNDLRDAGVSVQKTSDGWEFGATAESPVPVSAADLCRGMRRNLQDQVILREWAEFILAGSDIFDLDPLSTTQFGEECLEAIWDLSRGEMTTADAIVQRGSASSTDEAS